MAAAGGNRGPFAHPAMATPDDRVSIHGPYDPTHRRAGKDPELAIVVEGGEHPRMVERMIRTDWEAAVPAPWPPRLGPSPIDPVLGGLADLVPRRVG